MVNMGTFSPSNYGEDVVYVPIDDFGTGGGGSGGGSGELEGGGSNGDDSEHLYLIPDDEYAVFENVFLYTEENFPGKELGWAWRWWNNPLQTDENGFLIERKFELLHQLKQNDLFLTNCAELDAIIRFGPMFQRIAQFKVPQGVKDRLNWVKTQAPNFIVGNFNLQQLEEASGPVVNCDFFPVKIDKLPNGMNAQEFLEYFRLNINSFVTLSGLGATSFNPYKSGIF